jgi:hypothetical protein
MVVKGNVSIDLTYEIGKLNVVTCGLPFLRAQIVELGLFLYRI